MTQLMENNVHVANFAELEKQTNPGTPAWLEQLRRAAMSHFQEAGYPRADDEEWRFTNIAPVTRTRFNLAPQEINDGAIERAAAYQFGDEVACELVFVNGHYAPQLSRLGDLPRGVMVMPLGEAIAREPARLQKHLARHADFRANPFVALNTSFVQDGALIYVNRSVTVDRPVHLLFIDTGSSEPTVSHPRVLIVAEDNSELTIVKSFVGCGGPHLTNVVTEIVAGMDCRIEHNKLQHDCAEAFHVSTLQVRLERNCRFVSHAATLGGRVTRNDVNVVLAGEGAEAVLNGLVLIGGDQHCDNHTLLDHAAPNCPSHELYKHVLRDRATGVFKGKILVRQIAQKTDSKQTSKSLLLSDNAQMNSQPALEIYADDVKCTHGSTTGPVDEDMVFYLRSRGVSDEAARHLLTYAFAADITRRIRVEGVRRRLEDFMAEQAGLPQDLRITDLGAANEAHRT
jgi:Fe-S cluster assembly protein SufD